LWNILQDGRTNLPKISEPPKNIRHQKGDTKQSSMLGIHKFSRHGDLAPEKLSTHVLQRPISRSKPHLLLSMLTIHKFSCHGDLAPGKCAPLCYNILFLAANPTCCHPFRRSTNLVATANWCPRIVHPCATTSYFSQQNPRVVVHADDPQI